MCLREFSVVQIGLGVHNVCKKVGTVKTTFCSWSTQSKDYFTKHFKVTGIISTCVGLRDRYGVS
jgi:hypothetical protein